MAPQDDVAASGVEIPFKSHNIDPKDIQGGTKAAERKAKAKEAWHSELIRFEVWHESGEIEKFRLPRRKCQERSIQNFVFRSKKPFLIDYMQETETNEVIYLHEALSKCQGKPRNYKLVPRAIREIDDAADKDTYEGSLALVLDQVPVQNDGTGHDVKAEDIREWLMFGIQEEDDEVQNAVGRVEVIAEEIEEVKVNMADVPFMMLFDAAGKELDGDAAGRKRVIHRRRRLPPLSCRRRLSRPSWRRARRRRRRRRRRRTAAAACRAVLSPGSVSLFAAAGSPAG